VCPKEMLKYESVKVETICYLITQNELTMSLGCDVIEKKREKEMMVER